MEEFALRRTLSDELHARAFHDFDGAGRFIRFVYLTDGNSADILGYVNAFLDANGKDAITDRQKFLRLEMDGYALRVEQHTEFLSVSFVEKGHGKTAGLLGDAFDPDLTHLPLARRAASRPLSFTPSGWKLAASTAR